MQGFAIGFGPVLRGARQALDFLLPPRCLACEASIDAAGALCALCWGKVSFISPPYCARCGLPQEFDLGPASICAACASDTPAFARARAVMRYDEASRPLILAFKHADRTDAAPSFARWLLRAGAELVRDADLVVPVPLHWSRLFARRYNQAALLAQALARLSGLKAEPDLLARHRRTPSQGGRGRSGRRRNVLRAFAVRPRALKRLSGKRVLLIDDVLTTGATAEECSQTLLRAGASAVDVLTLARVVRT